MNICSSNCSFRCGRIHSFRPLPSRNHLLECVISVLTVLGHFFIVTVHSSLPQNCELRSLQFLATIISVVFHLPHPLNACSHVVSPTKPLLPSHFRRACSFLWLSAAFQVSCRPRTTLHLTLQLYLVRVSSLLINSELIHSFSRCRMALYWGPFHLARKTGRFALSV